MNRITPPTILKNNQSGFTLIELIMVIVILGIMAVVAIPRYANLQTEAAQAQAQGVFGACQGAAAINFAAGLVGATQPAGGVIDSSARLVAALDGGLPDGWTALAAPAKGITTTINAVAYTVTVTTDETATQKAVLTLTP